MAELSVHPVIAAARAIATVAHRGQVDKAGEPYIDHPRRVAERVAERDRYIPGDVAAAWLHDVLEDTDVTADDLLAAGIPDNVVGIVRAVTRTGIQSPEDYYAAVYDWPGARIVKLADIADNLDPKRLALLDDATIARLTRKYAKALEHLD